MTDLRRDVARAVLGYYVEAGVVHYDTDTREHDCATFYGDKVYHGDHDAWILYDKEGKRLSWAYRYGENRRASERSLHQETDEEANARCLDALWGQNTPNLPNDIGACIVELDRVCGDSTCRAWRIENSKWEWVERKRYYVCEIIDCDEMAVSETGATAAEACCKALIKWRKWEPI